MILQGEVAGAKVLVRNKGAAAVGVTFIPTCTCLTVTPVLASIPAGGRAVFDLSFDSAGDYGITERGYIVRTDPPASASAKPLYYELTGVVRVEKSEAPALTAAIGSAADTAGSKTLKIQYYYTPGCRSCEEFLRYRSARAGSPLWPRPGDRTPGPPPGHVLRRALRPSRLARDESRPRSPPLDWGKSSCRATPRSAPGCPASSKRPPVRSPRFRPGPPPESRRPRGRRLGSRALPVMAAGLVDGLNPCAFTTLIFLLASLALAGRGRMEVLVIGALFTLSVFLTYLGAGLGLFAAIRAASALSLVSGLLRWALVALLLAFAGLSVYDYILVRSGKASKMVLQLPTSLKLKIHSSIRTGAKAAALAGSSLAMGFFVSIFEFACTAQVYLPTLAYLARAEKRTRRPRPPPPLQSLLHHPPARRLRGELPGGQLEADHGPVPEAPGQAQAGPGPSVPGPRGPHRADLKKAANYGRERQPRNEV